MPLRRAENFSDATEISEKGRWRRRELPLALSEVGYFVNRGLLRDPRDRLPLIEFQGTRGTYTEGGSAFFMKNRENPLG